jgi:hypothetical protein
MSDPTTVKGLAIAEKLWSLLGLAILCTTK